MASPAPWSLRLTDAVRSGDAEVAVAASLEGLDAKVPWLEIVRAATLAYGESADVSGFPPHGLLALSSAVRVARRLPPARQALPVLQAVHLAAADPKLPESDRRKGVRVSGDVSHLTRSFEYAVRTGAFDDAGSIFAGLLPEGKERAMAGDALFRVAAEDLVHGGHKLLLAVGGWRLAAALGWRGAGTVMGPAVACIASGIQDDSAFRSWRAVWGRERVDIDQVAGNAGTPDEAERARITAALRASSPEGCAAGVVGALKRGAGLEAVAALAVAEAAARAASAAVYDLPSIHALLYADAARWVLSFSRTETRVLPLLQSCMLLQAQRREPADVVAFPAESLEAVVDALKARSPDQAGAAAAGYLAMGLPVPELVGLLCEAASRDGAAATTGHGLALADVAAGEALDHRPPETRPLLALARLLTLGPKERALYDAVKGRLGVTSS